MKEVLKAVLDFITAAILSTVVIFILGFGLAGIDRMKPGNGTVLLVVLALVWAFIRTKEFNSPEAKARRLEKRREEEG